MCVCGYVCVSEKGVRRGCVKIVCEICVLKVRVKSVCGKKLVKGTSQWCMKSMCKKCVCSKKYVKSVCVCVCAYM